MSKSITKLFQHKEFCSESIITPAILAKIFAIDQKTVMRVVDKYPMRINPYFLSLVKKADDPLGKQVIPDVAELEQEIFLTPDPLWEEPQSPVPNLIHRYPDRVVFMVSNQCAIYCRHCMRKRRLGQKKQVSESDVSEGIAYIRSNPAVRDVILSGGDPLMLSNDRIENILSQIRQIPHVQIIRIHTRIPCAMPRRVDEDLAGMLKQFHPLYMNIQFNHPDEITPMSEAACGVLADAGIPLGSQTVLLKGVNDDPQVMMALMQQLLAIRVRPYYLHHADAVEGTRHFRSSIKMGLEIMRHLRGRLSGIGVPQYMIDLPGGGGKVPLLPEYVVEEGPREMKVRNFEGEVFTYPLK
jgi:lysine 2,3-aminomutase